MKYTEQQLAEMFERSKDDRAMFVGSEIRVLIGMAQESLERSEAERSDAARYREALERIINGVPAHNDHGLYVAHFDGEGNEVGIEQVDPIAVIGSILGVAHAALQDCSTSAQNIKEGT